MIGEYQSARGTVRNLKEQLAKAEASLAKKEQELEQLNAGNWDVIKDEPKQQNNKNSDEPKS